MHMDVYKPNYRIKQLYRPNIHTYNMACMHIIYNNFVQYDKRKHCFGGIFDRECEQGAVYYVI